MASDKESLHLHLHSPATVILRTGPDLCEQSDYSKVAADAIIRWLDGRDLSRFPCLLAAAFCDLYLATHTSDSKLHNVSPPTRPGSRAWIYDEQKRMIITF